MKIDSDKVFFEILKELRSLNKTNKEMIKKYEKENIIVLNQMAEYLKDYQAVIDFQLKDINKHNQEMMRELKSHITRMSIFVDPNIAGAYRLNNVPISDPNSPINTLNRPIYLQYAENSASPSEIYNRAYYPVGYLVDLDTDYESINDTPAGAASPLPNLMGATQQLDIVSTSAEDKGTAPPGTGVREVILYGLNASGIRFNETITLDGTTTVTTINQFSQIDTCFSTETGTSEGAVGTISIDGANDAVTYGAITIGENQWRSGRFFTDSNAAAYIDQWSFGCYKNTVRGNLKANNEIGNLYALLTRSNCIVENTTFHTIFPVPIRIPKNSLVLAAGIADSVNTEVTTSFILHFREE